MNMETNRNNFDLIRLCLALMVFAVHACELTRLEELSFIVGFISSDTAIDSFFVISGFLIFASYEKSGSLKNYFGKRIRRIFPGYIAVILSCSFFLTFLSRYGFYDYFTWPWVRYIIANVSTLNFLEHTLPGVFEGNHLPTVNGALWTIKIEVGFYLIVPMLAFLLSKTNKLALILIIYFTAVFFSLGMNTLAGFYQSPVFIVLERQLPGQLAFFMSGALLFYFLSHFKRYSSLYLLSGILGYIVSKYFGFYIVYPVSLAVLVIYSALILKYLGNWGKFGDFSYGIYIWHFPIIQVFIHFNLFGPAPFWGITGLVFTVLTAAVLSWHFIEKPFLSRRSHYRKAEVTRSL